MNKKIKLGTWKPNEFSKYLNWEDCYIPSELHNLIQTQATAAGYGNGYRRSQDFVAAGMIIIDVDNKVIDSDDSYTIEMAKEDFDGYSYIISTTKSHMKDKKTNSGDIFPPQERFRVYLFFDKEITCLKHYKQFAFNFLKDKIQVLQGIKDDKVIKKDPRIDVEAAIFPLHLMQPSSIVKNNFGQRVIVTSYIEPSIKYTISNISAQKHELFRSTREFLKKPPAPGSRNIAFVSACSDLKRCRYSTEEAESLLFSSLKWKQGSDYPSRIRSIYDNDSYGLNMNKKIIKTKEEAAKAVLSIIKSKKTV